VLADDRVVLGADAHAGVLVGDQGDHRRQHRRVVDVLGVGQHRHRQRHRLLAGLVVRLVEDVLQFRVVAEHALIEIRRQGNAVLLEHRDGGLDQFANAGVHVVSLGVRTRRTSFWMNSSAAQGPRSPEILDADTRPRYPLTT
jgi:hypothetical protein